MDLTYPDDVEAYRQRIIAFVENYVGPGWKGLGALAPDDRPAFLVRWRLALRDEGLLAAGWPQEYGGGGLTLLEQSVAAEELTRRGLPSLPAPNDPSGFVLLGPTLLNWGTPEQKLFFLPRTLSGEIRWCQGYSEPEAGSDLFNVQTRAESHQDRWIINGQKIWTSQAMTANWIFALVRTDPTAERSKGLSFLLVPLDQPGVDVRPITNMAGEAEFAEVFFTDAVTDASNIVGLPGQGARIALTLLGFERGADGVAAALGHQIELERLCALASQRGLMEEPHILRRIGECRASVFAMHCLALKDLCNGLRGDAPGAESSVGKLYVSHYRQRVTELAMDILGSDGLVRTGEPSVFALGAQPLGVDPLASAAWIDDYLHARPGTVYGGSSQIQRNTIAEQILGLPREPRASIKMPDGSHRG